MSQIKAKNTEPEILVRKFLFSKGLRYKLHDKKLPGKPDMVFPKYRKILFIHGCFWHGHNNCKYYVIPKTKTEWWLNKISTNKNKDVYNLSKLKKLGWKVVVAWECDLKPLKRDTTLNKIFYSITGERKTKKKSRI